MTTRGRPRYPETLTPRQQEVLALVREGLTNEEIAQRLGITLDGAKFHVSEILARLGASSRHEAAEFALAPTPARRAWVLAPLALLGKLKWNAAATVAAGVTTAAAGIAIIVLAWAVVHTHSGDTASLVAVPTATSDNRGTPSTVWNRQYAITLDLPAGWQADPGYLQDDREYSGYMSGNGRAAGHLSFSAAGGPNLEYVVDATAHHKLKPYGENPVIVDDHVPAGDALLILPDPSAPNLHDAALVIPYPTSLHAVPVPSAFRYFTLYADEQSIRELTESLRFVDPASVPAPVSPPGAASDPAAAG